MYWDVTAITRKHKQARLNGGNELLKRQKTAQQNQEDLYQIIVPM